MTGIFVGKIQRESVELYRKTRERLEIVGVASLWRKTEEERCGRAEGNNRGPTVRARSDCTDLKFQKRSRSRQKERKVRRRIIRH